MITIELMKKYSKKEIMDLLEFNNDQLEKAINTKLIGFFDNHMYGVYFFQFLQNNSTKLESLKNI